MEQILELKLKAGFNVLPTPIDHGAIPGMHRRPAVLDIYLGLDLPVVRFQATLALARAN